MNKIIVFLIVLLTLCIQLAAQNVSINTDGSAPNPSSMLDIKSISKGLLMPRLTSVQRTGISAPAKGLILYDSTTNSFWFYKGSAWTEISDAANVWNLTGNTATNPATNFIGTTDVQPLRFRVNNAWAGEIHPTSGNLFLGVASGQANTTGYLNTAFGNASLKNNTVSNFNVAIGDSALYNHIGFGGGNTAVGSHALFASINGNLNTAVGYYSLSNNTDGVSNTAVGINTLANNIYGYENTAIGSRALQYNTSVNNTAIGANALRFNDNGIGNTSTGSKALYSNISGNRNTANGESALYFNSIGNHNTANGSFALNGNTTSNFNIAIGSSALTTQSYNNGGVAWDADNVAVGYSALYFNQPTSIFNGIQNTAIGNLVLEKNQTGYSNTAMGYAALNSNTNGHQNTAIGQGALYSNTSGHQNTAIGYSALSSDTSGYHNTAIGYSALSANTKGNFNNAFGMYALTANSTAVSNVAMGNYALSDQSFSNGGISYTGGNVAIGVNALFYNNPISTVTGVYNTAVGLNSLFNNVTGSGNTALGYNAGPNTGAISNTTCIGNGTIATANNQMVLGNAAVTEFYCYGAYAGTTAGASNLTVLNTGQIVRSTSSRRYKKDIVPIDINTASIYKLRPVSYNSFTDADRHFGLIAEEVAEVIPELASYAKEKQVVKGSSSDKMIPDAVQYPLLSVLLLKEVQKHEQTINKLQATIEVQQIKILQQQQQYETLLKRIEMLEKKNKKL